MWMHADESLDTVKIEALSFFFFGLSCLSVKSMTILVRFLTPAASSSMEGGCYFAVMYQNLQD